MMLKKEIEYLNGKLSLKDECVEYFKDVVSKFAEKDSLAEAYIGELQLVRAERDRLTSKLVGLELEGSGAEVDKLCKKCSALEEACSSQRQYISLLQSELVAANKEPHLSSDIRKEYEDQKRLITELKEKLAESENLIKDLHNTILELKGNIRVFCRVRPLLSNDGPQAESTITYPTSSELAG